MIGNKSLSTKSQGELVVCCNLGNCKALVAKNKTYCELSVDHVPVNIIRTYFDIRQERMKGRE
jgi:serine/threonine protein phosphatase PrpC